MVYAGEVIYQLGDFLMSSSPGSEVCVVSDFSSDGVSASIIGPAIAAHC